MASSTGDPFLGFYNRALPEVYGYLANRLPDVSRVEAVTQEVFMAIVPQWPFPANVADGVALAVGIARRKLADEYRRQDQQVKRRRNYAALSAEHAAHRTAASVEMRVQWALAAVPADQRLALVLRRVDHLTVEEVGGILGKSARAAQSLLARGERTLRRAFAAEESSDSGFDPFRVMSDRDSPVAPPEDFGESLYELLRTRLDVAAVGGPQEVPPAEPRRGPLVVVAVLGALLVMAGVLGWLTPTDDAQPGGVVDPSPLSEPDTSTSGVDHNSDPAVIGPSTVRPGGGRNADSGGGYGFGGWRVLPASEFDGRVAAAVTWTGERLIVWGGEVPDGGPRPDFGWPRAGGGGTYDPQSGMWSQLPPSPISARAGANVIWDGDEMLIFGGGGAGAGYRVDGGGWRVLPSHRIAPNPSVAVWTGSEAIVFGRAGASGEAFDPVAGSWRELPAAPLFSSETWDSPGGLWTGSEMIVWSDIVHASFPGAELLAAFDLAAYDPAADAWRRFPPPPFEYELSRVTGVWTGEEIILWGANFAGSAPDGAAPLAGVALNPGTGEWRKIAFPSFARIGESPAFGLHSAVWTGSRMVVWAGGSELTAAPELWSYDPATNAWERGASSPLPARDPELIWTGDTLLAYGGRIAAPLERTLAVDLGVDGSALPDPAGSSVRTYLHPPLPFEVLAIGPSTGRAAVVDFAAGVATVYEEGESLLPRSGAIDMVAPLGNGWMTIAQGNLWWFANGIASQPSAIQEVGSDSGAWFAYVLPADEDQYPDTIWTVERGQPFGDLRAPSVIRSVSLATGDVASVSRGPADVVPVVASSIGLLLNGRDWIDTGDGLRVDPRSLKMTLVRPDGTIQPLWGGWGLHLSADRLIWLDCDATGGQCSIVVSTLAEIGGEIQEVAGVAIKDEAASFGGGYQPGVSLVSPDGRWLLAERIVAEDADGQTSIELIDLETLEHRELIGNRTIDSLAGPGAVWSYDSEWVLVLDGRPTAVHVADGLQVDLWEWLPTDMEIYAVASR